MDNNLKIAITRIEKNTCDLSDKETECVVCTVGDDTECVIATGKFMQFLRLHQKQLARKNGNGGASRQTSKSPLEK